MHSPGEYRMNWNNHRVSVSCSEVMGRALKTRGDGAMTDSQCLPKEFDLRCGSNWEAWEFYNREWSVLKWGFRRICLELVERSRETIEESPHNALVVTQTQQWEAKLGQWLWGVIRTMALLWFVLCPAGTPRSTRLTLFLPCLCTHYWLWVNPATCGPPPTTPSLVVWDTAGVTPSDDRFYYNCMVSAQPSRLLGNFVVFILASLP